MSTTRRFRVLGLSSSLVSAERPFRRKPRAHDVPGPVRSCERLQRRTREGGSRCTTFKAVLAAASTARGCYSRGSEHSAGVRSSRKILKKMGSDMRVQQLSYAWPGSKAFIHDLSFELPPGSRCLLLGCNGAGASFAAAATTGCGYDLWACSLTQICGRQPEFQLPASPGPLAQVCPPSSQPAKCEGAEHVHCGCCSAVGLQARRRCFKFLLASSWSILAWSASWMLHHSTIW